jgi:magnesium transporter
VRLADIGESMRDLVSSALSSYLSVINNRLNDVMKTLTVITTLFMPISFLTGFFGMNFFQPVFNSRVWTGAIAFTIVLIVVISVPTMMLIWIKKQRWM